MSWAAKWAGDDGVICQALCDDDNYTAGQETDAYLCQTLWELLDEADVVVGHNMRRFDAPKINTMFINNGFYPPSPYKIVDTLDVCKKHFSFTSNKLDFVCKKLLGQEKAPSGFGLWLGCLEGKTESWSKMMEYNIQDVIILEELYKKLLPYISNHPNAGLYTDDADTHVCPKCGGTHLQRRGFYFTNAGKYQRYRCNSCGGWSRSRCMDIEKEHKGRLVSNAV